MNAISSITISEIRSSIGVISSQLYTTDIGQEGHWYYDDADTTSPDNLGTLLVTADGKRFKRTFDDVINLRWFGAKGDYDPVTKIGTDDSMAFQLAVNYASKQTAAPVYSGTSSIAGVKKLFLDKGLYLLNLSINIPSRIDMVGSSAILIAPDNGRIFTSATAYRVKFENIIFHGNDVEAVYFNIPNLDNARYEFKNCTFSTHSRTINRYAIYIKSQSAVVSIIQCDNTASPNYLKLETDFCDINGGWINGWSVLSAINGTKNADTCSIENRCRKMSIGDVTFIPERDGSGIRPKVRWIDNYGKLSIRDSHFGSENGGFPIVYQFLSSVSDAPPYVKDADILIDSCQASCGGANRIDSAIIVLMQDVIPGRFTISNVTRIVDSMLISAIGYDFAGTIESTNTLLMNNLYNQTNRTLLNQIDIRYSAISIPSGVPKCLLPFVNRVPAMTQGAHGSLALNDSIVIVDLLKIIAGASPQRAAITADVMIQVSFTVTGPRPIVQKKGFRITALWETGVTPYLDVSGLSFSEFAPTGGAVSDTLITLIADNSTKTTTKAQWKLSIAGGISNVGVSWVIYNIQSSLNNGANAGTFIARNY